MESQKNLEISSPIDNSTNNSNARPSKRNVGSNLNNNSPTNLDKQVDSASPGSNSVGSNKSSSSGQKYDKKPKQSANSTTKKPKSGFISNNNQKFNINSNRFGNHGSSYENYGLEDDSPLFGISGNDRKGTKKTNLNHLLNFTYDSRDPLENYYEYEKSAKQFWSTKLSKGSVFNKEQFLQANCQFVVKNNGDYTVHMVDPDRLVDWEKIEEIHLETLESISCPICLYEPVCGKMTKCGHMYCWSCILHYLSLSDKPWRKCPICYESIYKNDLKSVKIIKHKNEFKVNDVIKMNLMFRYKTKFNTIILPASLYDVFLDDERNNKHVTFNLFNSDKYSEFNQYFKIHCKTSEQIFEEIIKREKVELERQVQEEKNQPEVCFVNEAIALLEEREASLKLEMNTKRPKALESIINKKDPVIKETKSEEKPEINIDKTVKPSETFVDAFENVVEEKPFQTTIIASEEKEIQKNEEKISEIIEEKISEIINAPVLSDSNNESEQTEASSKNNKIESQNTSDMAFFYQSTDGQRIYLNGLNNRCIISEYSSLNKGPLTLSARIVSQDSFFMTEENRKRYKYLAHLPLHSEFKLAELDLKEPIISQKTLNLFHDEIQERKKFRERKLNREKREADRIAALNESTPHYYVQSAMNDKPVHYIKSSTIEPVLDYASEFPEASTSPPISSGGSLGETSSVGTGSSVGGINAEQVQKSFAQMLKIADISKDNSSQAANNAKTAWPALESANGSLASSNQLTSGWVTMAKQQQQQQSMLGKAKRCQPSPSLSPWAKLSSGAVASNENSISEEQDSEHLPAPLYKQSFFSAIDESLKLLESKKSLEQEEATNSGKTNPKQDKKKKKTKQLLFSTSLNMGF